MNQLKTIPLIAMLMLAGCLATADTNTSKKVVEYEPVMYYNNSSYQFDNLAPMSYGESFNLTLNETTTLYVELYTRFHDPLVWEKGMFNLSLVHDNYTWSFETNDTTIQEFNHTFNQSGNFTVHVRASGSDDPADEIPGDAYIAYLRFETGKQE